MNLLDQPRGRLVLFTLLYVGEGAPIGFVWWALPTWLRGQDISLERISGLLALLVLPWALKFLWAPLVDAWRSPRWGFRGWILGAQIMMGLALLPLVELHPAEHWGTWTFFLLLHALAAATQDVAVDGLAIRCVSAHERGRVNGCMQAGLLVGRGLFAGGTLWWVDRVGMGWVLVLMIFWIWGTMSCLLWVREKPRPDRPPSPWKEWWRHLRGVVHRRSSWWGLAFALTGAAGFEALGAVAGPFLIDHGLDQETVAKFVSLAVVGPTLLGGLIGGPISDRWGRTRSVAMFLAGFALVILSLAWLDHTDPTSPPGLFMALFGLMYFLVGLFTAASYALFMDLTDPELGATQFSTYMAATNVCESWAVKSGGLLITRFGYPGGAAVMALVSLASLAFLHLIDRTLPGRSSPPKAD